MGRSQETFGKKEVRKKKDKKRKDKEQKRAKKKVEGKKTNFDDMIAYVDEFGMITSTPPDPDKKIDVEVDSIELKITKNNPQSSPDFVRKGVVSTFNKSKGYGFIRDLSSNQSVFVHVNSLLESIKENDVVIFEIGKGAKGPAAMKVKLFKE
ncbi:MAG: cold shock domain-containing protein [Bacteroidales bacterium]|nr:cold shock domain-containing protein [Bacteroidales bacterium]